MTPHPPRDDVISYLRSVLLGPRGGETEEVVGTPFLRYMTGILFPIDGKVEAVAETTTATAEDSQASVGEDDEGSDSDAFGSVSLTSEALPSAVAISFKVPDACTLSCAVWAARYEPDGDAASKGRGATVWKRKPLGSETSPEQVSVSKLSTRVKVFQGLAELVSRWRSLPDGTAIVTIALVNAQRSVGRGADPGSSLFQVGLRCSAEVGVLPYPQVGSTHDNLSEEAEVEFLYRSETPFARGHGAAAKWAEPSEGLSGWVAVDFIPSFDVPKATFELSAPGVHASACDLDFLIRSPRAEVVNALRSLAESYGKWLDGGGSAAAGSQSPDIGKRFVERARDWLRRMRLGLELLERDEVAWRSFRLANEAMAMQMVLIKSRPKSPHARSARASCPPMEFKGRSWRPFQIAFVLGAIESLVNDGSIDRTVVDVIWFPTGGGKTEAYLFACAFELVRRRMVHGARDTATAIFSRYTLRFLTVQQFQRTGALVIALELLRRRSAGELGDRQFTLGLWVGQQTTPNRYRDAHHQLQEQLESRNPRNRFQLQCCPCCGTEIFPSTAGRGRSRHTADDFGVVATPTEFHFRCPSTACEFSSGLPLNVIDEALYAAPPSILLGTIDKFAMLPWDDRARSFFGGADDHSPPPSLVLQDELHLISGPLGSLAAPYDAAIDTVISMRRGILKRIGSTATIRNAREQVRGLYGRDVAVFPSPVGKWDNAFFFSTDQQSPGRTYVGVMGQGYIKPVVAMAWTAAAILQSVKEVSLDPDTLDAYWTLVAYHNSRRELGRTLTAARDDVQARVAAIASSPAIARTIGEPLELSAQMVKSLGEAIEALEKPHSAQDPSVDLVPCTSIISVGVDLDRLGVMLMNGQPKLTSEYIQATSRVGRGKVPGLVVSLFSGTKPRDRSHYEDFRAYHQSIYRHVEPTSVTPYALPARERTLHAALVSVMRHATPFHVNESAKTVAFADAGVRAAVAHLLDVMCQSDPSEAEPVTSLMEQRLEEWKEMSEAGFALLYERRRAGHQFTSLLSEYGKALGKAVWPTMMSVRNVDAEVTIKIE